MLDLSNTCSLVIGRTGVGKTALLSELRKTAEHAIDLAPENLSIDYIANSNILQFMHSSGVNLDVLFRLLWRHVIVVELLKYKYSIRNETAMDSFKQAIGGVLKKDKPKKKAIEYLQKWGDQFWEETEDRVREVVSSIETELSGGFSSSAFNLQGGAEAAKKLTETERREVVNKSKGAIQKIQIKELGEVVSFLAEDVFTDRQKKYFVLIDRLDENWASDDIKYKILRALIEEMRTFRSITTLKLVVAMRLDVVERIFSEANDTGFQEEKYRDLMMPLMWSQEHLQELVEKRINYLLRYKYTSQSINFDDIFPGKVGKRKTFEYILQRTFNRPRDVITYVNYVLDASVGKSSITQDVVRGVEEQYSEDRSRSIIDEWVSIYPNLSVFLPLLDNRQDGFRLGSIDGEELMAVANSVVQRDGYKSDTLGLSAEKFLNGEISESFFRIEIARSFYRVGVVGVKKDSQSPTRWSFEERMIYTNPNVKGNSRIYVHPMMWRRFSIVRSEDCAKDA
ncbi:hypothetical protein SAMN04487954_1153 [Billgrantia gudaonensis]|uniref:DNA repair ATPase n=1 Tax=Billgrantia gudaonensis TaxID=376427 RepID=A0A1G9B5N0_9GAMM|nr:hypothetical protein SAMN04487954_1153 [Halomonas gudaonensis]